MPGRSAKAGILDHAAQRRGGVMIDSRMQLYLGKAYLPKSMQKLGQIPFGLLTHSCNLHAVEQHRRLRCRERAEAMVISTSGHNLFRGVRIFEVGSLLYRDPAIDDSEVV